MSKDKLVGHDVKLKTGVIGRLVSWVQGEDKIYYALLEGDKEPREGSEESEVSRVEVIPVNPIEDVPTEESEPFHQIIHNIDPKNRLKALSWILILMQKEIIGYFHVNGQHQSVVEDQDSVIKTITVTASLGLHEEYLPKSMGEYHPFPKGQSLSEMMKDPHGFYEWCLEHRITIPAHND